MKTTLRTVMILALVAIQSTADGCTTFCIRSGNALVVGKNFDFYTGSGQIVINKRGAFKSSLELPPEKQFSWTARYGSITFNQMGVEFPYGGMNEKGLVIEISWLEETAYPEKDERNGLVELQWIQYQLDNSATVTDVLESDARLRISKQSLAPVHFFVCDAEGNTATFEYVNGRLEAHTAATMPVCVLANDTYSQSTRYLNSLKAAENPKRVYSSSSYDRFAQASMMINAFDGKEPVDYAFHTLKQVKQEGFTQWSIVYDVKNRRIHYRTAANPTIRKLALETVDFSCSHERLVADIDHREVDGKTWSVYSFEKNFDQIKRAFAACEFLKDVPAAELLLVARYPETVTCK